MRARHRIARLLIAGLLLLIPAAPGYATHEGIAPAAEIRTTPGGVKYLAHLELMKLMVCSTCPFDIHYAPEFVSATEAAGWLPDDRLVVGVQLGGVIKAYPVQLLGRPSSHVINDEFKGLPVIVSWCPLCHSAVVLKRPTIDGHILEFATAGAYQRNLVMYDTRTVTLWAQITAEPIAGPLLGRVGHLHAYPAEVVLWGAWKQAHPQTEVLKGSKRSGDAHKLVVYEAIAQGRDERSDVSHRDSRLPVYAIVFGIVTDGAAKAYPKEALDRIHVVNDVVGKTEILVLSNPLSGEVKFFRRHIPGQPTLVFESSSRRLVDTATGTIWNFDGVAEMGRLVGTRLEQIPGVSAFWFAWSTFFPKTELFH